MFSLIPLANYVVYDTSVWTEFGYAIQRYIGAAATVGIRIAIPIVGVSVVILILKSFMGLK